MMRKPSIISIGYGRHFFDASNNERARLRTCAQYTNHLHSIIFTDSKDGYEVEQVSDTYTLHPTDGRSAVRKMLQAVRIAVRLVSNDKAADWVVTAQDPFVAGIVAVVVRWLRPSVHLTIQEHGDVYSTDYWRRESVRNRVLYIIGTFVLRQADTIRVVSERTEQYMKALYPRARVTRLPVAIDAGQFVQSASMRQVKSAGEPFDFLWVGRLVPQKNLPMLLRIFATVHKKHPYARLRIVGEGPLRSELDALSAQLFSQHDTMPVVFSGWTDEVGELMRSADAYVLSSHYEGWARVLIEAMLAGLPTVTTDVGCVGEVLLHKQHGLVVPVDDEVAFTAALERMVVDESLRQKIHRHLAALKPDEIPGVGIAETYGQAWVAAHT